MLDKNVSIH